MPRKQILLKEETAKDECMKKGCAQSKRTHPLYHKENPKAFKPLRELLLELPLREPRSQQRPLCFLQ